MGTRFPEEKNHIEICLWGGWRTHLATDGVLFRAHVLHKRSAFEHYEADGAGC